MQFSPIVLSVIELEERARRLERDNYRLTLLLSDADYRQQVATRDLTNQVAHLQWEVDRLRVDRNTRYRERGEYKDKCAELHARLLELENTSAVQTGLECELAEQRARADELQAKVTAGNQRNRALGRELKLLRNELDDVKALSDAEVARITAESKKRIEHLEAGLERTQLVAARVATVEHERREAVKRASVAEQTVELTKKRLDGTRRALEAAKSDAERYKTMVKTIVLKPGSAQVRYVPPTDSEREELLRHYDFTLIAAHNSLVYFGKCNLMLRQHVDVLKARLQERVAEFDELKPQMWDDFIVRMPVLYEEKCERLRANLCETMYGMALAACENIGRLFSMLPIKSNVDPHAIARRLIEERLVSEEKKEHKTASC
jgi:hypothetical protein